ncbi:MAG TPA: hypothetical protein VHC20_03055 [Candidatus Paceibacterota bacterium]|nr:hypothetical protein [Candidatus Paceibacterota bacterium]
MFERYLGRNANPKVKIESHEPATAPPKAWVDEAASDPEFMKWYAGSVLVDSAGKPIPVFHGTRGLGEFGRAYERAPNELGVHFGASSAASERLTDTFDSDLIVNHDWLDKSHALIRENIHTASVFSQEEKQRELSKYERIYEDKHAQLREREENGIHGGEKIFPVFLRIKNPVRLKDPGSFSEDHLKQIKKDLVRNFVTRDQVSKIKSATTIEELRKTLIELGYDGVVYENGVEGRGTDSYIPIVGAEQIRDALSATK